MQNEIDDLKKEIANQKRKFDRDNELYEKDYNYYVKKYGDKDLIRQKSSRDYDKMRTGSSKFLDPQKPERYRQRSPHGKDGRR